MTEYNRDECIQALQAASNNITGVLSKGRFDEWNTDGPTSDQISYKFGTWNAAKEEAGLTQLQGGPGEIPPPPENVDMDEDEWEELSMNKRKHRRRYAKLSAIKMGDGCSICGYDEHPSALSFHHSNPDEKRFNIGQNGCKPWDEVLSEIEKCEVLCRNCHQIKSNEMSWLNL